jgi:hypothetical protein
MKEKIIPDIVNLEWDMFSRVRNVGGGASCQEDRYTFEIMRSCQAETWTTELLQSYHRDLLEAKSAGRNLVSEKYARMMESTFPEEYARLAGALPTVEKDTLNMIEEIVEINLRWKLKTAGKYPKLSSRGRPTYSKEDCGPVTSFESYLRGELKTYSSKTVGIYRDMVIAADNKGENLEEVCLLNTVRKYGYESLEAAERMV